MRRAHRHAPAAARAPGRVNHWQGDCLHGHGGVPRVTLAPAPPIRAVPRLGALLLRMQAASLRPLVVHRAQPRLGVEKVAIPTAPPRHGEDHVLVVEVVNQPRLLQPLGNVPGLLVLSLERIHQAQPHQVCQLHLQRHGAAIGRAGLAQARAIAGPAVQAVYVNDGDGGAHGKPRVFRKVGECLWQIRCLSEQQ